jgi:hypothetical protein
MRESARGLATIEEHGGDLSAPPSGGYYVVEASDDAAQEELSEELLSRTFLLEGAKLPGMFRFVETHQMLGGFSTEEWFQLEGLETVRLPVLRIEVADALGFERCQNFATEHYAQYYPGLGLPELLVRYISEYHRWRASATERLTPKE